MAPVDNVIAQVWDVSDRIGRISSATNEQTQGIGQVGAAVNELDRTTQQNAALVEQSAAASGSLSEHSRRLADTVRVFKLVEATSPLAA